MNVKECEGCPFFGRAKMRCYCDVEDIAGKPLNELSACTWNSRRIKNQRAVERRNKHKEECLSQ